MKKIIKHLIPLFIGVVTLCAFFDGQVVYASMRIANNYNDIRSGTTNFNDSNFNSAGTGDILSKPEKGWSRYDNTNSIVNYSGAWVYEDNFEWNKYYKGTRSFHRTKENDYFDFNINCKRVRLIGFCEGDDNRVYCDGSFAGTLKNKDRHDPVNNIVMFEYEFNDDSTHNIRVECDKFTRKTNYDAFISFDAFDISNQSSNIATGQPNIVDNKLKNEICSLLGKNENETLTRDDMKKVTRLDAANKGIKSLVGLEYCTNLQSANLAGNEISDLSPIINLSNLEWLNIPDNKIVSLSPLRHLNKLNTLILNNNKNISDLTPLDGLTNLESLSVGNCNISNVAPLAKLFNLQNLYLNNNNISNISKLKENTKLKRLSIAYNKIDDIFYLYKMTNLEELAANDNNINYISVFSYLPNLKYLSIGNNKFSDISSLAKLTKLNTLLIYGCNIKDISPLKNLTELKTLEIYNNEISDFSAISSLNIPNLNTGNQRV